MLETTLILAEQHASLRKCKWTMKKYLCPIGCFFSFGCTVLRNVSLDQPELPADEHFQRSLYCSLQFLSRGLQNGWHGKFDILIMDKDESGQPALGLPVFIVESFDDDDNVSVSSANSYNNHKDNSWAQSIAETIVFSFLQRKQNFGHLQNCLIPGIGISSEKLVVCMYDCENDVLLGSVGMDLFDKGDVHMRAIIFLWLVLNYKLFCSGVIDDFKSYRANFHRLVGDEKLEQYKTEVSFPFCINYTKNKRFDPNKLYTPTNLKRSIDCPEVKSLKLFKKK